ncbi:hypothetical protein [Fusobacterium ulcerans]|uniref:Uncharacterized protein n=1 Tax=Fusobacterium ulcerans 12-1B TaxID=457404 RepID=H1PPC2_9FUSO|nr:hypothetical protein [Fusobacterium ulcerans]EHO84446.1 hypothetical protein HMPREF0402_00265 [Fusobacterium ulcerans 12-1B]
MYNKGHIYISPQYKMEDYINLELSINSSKEIWNKGIKIFKDRLNGRFMNRIKLLINQQYEINVFEKNRPGEVYSDFFIITAIISLLIETLLQFDKGILGTKGSSKMKYIEFLTTKKPFSKEFSKKTAEIFYEDVRCGILHSAQTNRNTQLGGYCCEEKIFEEINNGIRVDVYNLFAKIEEYINNYISLLKDPSQEEIRKNFIKKMNYIINKGKQNKKFNS